MTRGNGGAAQSVRLKWKAMAERHVRRLRQADDRGMTLIELIVTVALTAIVITMTTFLIVGVLNATSGEDATISGVQQATLAERSFTQYMRSTVQLLTIKSNDLTFQAYAGMGCAPGVSQAACNVIPLGSAASDVPQIETMEIQLCATKSKYVDSLEVLYGLPQTGSGSLGLHECISPNSVTTTTSAVPSGVRLVEAFDIAPPGVGVPDIFSYYTFQGSSFTAESTTVAAATPTAVAAVGINVTFLPPPGGVSKGYHTELGTTVSAEVFLRNSTTSS